MAVVKVPIARIITGHKAVREALRNTELYSSDLQGDADVRDYRQIPLEVDPPKHHLYRAALAPFFVKPHIEKYVEIFTEHTKSLLDSFMKDPGADVVTSLALPLVMHNLGALYGREQDVSEWIGWGPDVWTATGSKRDGAVLHSYLDRIYDEALAQPNGDIWSQLASLEIEEEQITPLEFRGIAGIMLAGGRDTIVKMFAGIIWYFGKNPHELISLREDPQYIDRAVQEFLRFLTPNTAMARTTTPESSQTSLPDDRYVSMSFLSGNFDESIYPNPTTVDLRRERNPHLSFGFGPHTCIGNHLAEFEVRIFLQSLISSNYMWSVESSSEITFHPDPLQSVPHEFKNLLIRLAS